MKNVPIIIVTNTEMGWDCVVGVYQGTEEDARAALLKAIGEPEDAEICDTYIFHETVLKIKD